jgi:hypothetical protein
LRAGPPGSLWCGAFGDVEQIITHELGGCTKHGSAVRLPTMIDVAGLRIEDLDAEFRWNPTNSEMRVVGL